jgi:hypothetical protein
MTKGIVDPEPHSPRNLRRGWEHIPRWARFALWAIAVAALILVAYLTR